jgi:hypothetical protein
VVRGGRRTEETSATRNNGGAKTEEQNYGNNNAKTYLLRYKILPSSQNKRISLTTACISTYDFDQL